MNAYDFQLTTLLVIDDHGEGYPVAFCFSNHANQRAMEAFLVAVKQAVKYSIDNVVLMSDDAEAYRNAWLAVMGSPKAELLCAWHIELGVKI